MLTITLNQILVPQVAIYIIHWIYSL